MKELIKLYLTFFKIGIVNFGGGYAMLPLLQKEIVEKNNWATDDELNDFFAIGQCTPGAIAVNVSTFIGYRNAGVFGGIISTLGFVSPAFIIIFLIASILTNFSDNIYVNYALSGIRVAVVALVLQAIIKLSKKSIKDVVGIILCIIVSVMAIFIKEIPLFSYIIFAGIFGIIYNVLKEKRRVNKEKIEEVKEEKKEKPEKRYFILGLILGFLIGFFAFLLKPVIKKKNYSVGVLSASCFWLIMVVCAIVSIANKDTTFFRLFFNFFRIGICAFGGGLATIPFLSELGETTGWFSSLDLANMIAVSESTPGAMGINMSTYTGYNVANYTYNNMFLSFIGSLISTLGLVTPSIIVISIVNLFLDKFKTNKFVQYAFYGLRIASIGLIIAAFYSILKISVIDVNSASLAINTFNSNDFFSSVKTFINALIRWDRMFVALCLIFFVFKFKKHPIFYIVIAAILGIILKL